MKRFVVLGNRYIGNAGNNRMAIVFDLEAAADGFTCERGCALCGESRLVERRVKRWKAEALRVNPAVAVFGKVVEEVAWHQ